MGLDKWHLSEIRSAILSERGEELMRLVSALGLREDLSAHTDEAVALALRLRVVWRHKAGGLHLSPMGYSLSDSAREYCGWMDGGRRLASYVPEDLIKGKRVLDVGCGFGRFLWALEDHGAAKPVGIDALEVYPQLSQALAAREHRGPSRILVARGEHIPFGDASFDVLVCHRALGYMYSRATLSEFSRVLVKGGCAIITVATLQHLLVRAWRELRRGAIGRPLAISALNLIETIMPGAVRVLSLGRPASVLANRSRRYPSARALRRELARCGLVVRHVNTDSGVTTPTFLAVLQGRP